MRIALAAIVLLLCTSLALAGISCSHCGALNPNSAGHCMMCGHAIGSRPPPRTETPPEPPPQAAPAAPPQVTHTRRHTERSERIERAMRTPHRPARTRRQRRALMQEPAAPPRERPIRPEPAPTPVPAARGTLIIELNQSGDAMMASSFSVTIDGLPAGQGQLKGGGLLHSGMARSYHYERSLPPGVHRVRLSLMGVNSDLNERPVQERSRDFTVTVVAGQISKLGHSWTGGIQEFAQ